jgi:hypothetical protein
MSFMSTPQRAAVDHACAAEIIMHASVAIGGCMSGLRRTEVDELKAYCEV